MAVRHPLSPWSSGIVGGQVYSISHRRSQYYLIVRTVGEAVRVLEGTDGIPGFAETRRVLFEIRFDAITRTGRHTTMVRLLEQMLQDSRATRIEEEVCERNRPTISN